MRRQRMGKLLRPIAGVVIGITRSALRVKLESGLVIITQRRKDYKIGSKCWVAYDFTESKVKSLFNHDPALAVKQDTTEEVVQETEKGDDNDIVEATGIFDSGALPPDSDCWEFWNSDSGVLELS